MDGKKPTRSQFNAFKRTNTCINPLNKIRWQLKNFKNVNIWKHYKMQILHKQIIGKFMLKRLEQKNKKLN